VAETGEVMAHLSSQVTAQIWGVARIASLLKQVLASIMSLLLGLITFNFISGSG